MISFSDHVHDRDHSHFITLSVLCAHVLPFGQTLSLIQCTLRCAICMCMWSYSVYITVLYVYVELFCYSKDQGVALIVKDASKYIWYDSKQFTLEAPQWLTITSKFYILRLVRTITSMFHEFRLVRTVTSMFHVFRLVYFLHTRKPFSLDRQHIAHWGLGLKLDSASLLWMSCLSNRCVP